MSECHNIAELGRMLRGQSCSSEQLLDTHLQRIRAFDGALNCFVSLDAEAARRAAAESDERLRNRAARSPLDGIPVAVKDNIHVNGFATRNGSLHDFSVATEARVSAKLRAAGAVIVGKLNMDECAFGATTDNPHTGRTINPWKPGHIPGGSSGGAGAAVAAGFAVAALGTDTLGSVRLPAGYCGVVGLKPSRGLVSLEGVVPLSPTLDHVGPICRTVEDVRLMLEVLADSPSSNWSAASSPRNNLVGIRIGRLARDVEAGWTKSVRDGFDNAVSDTASMGAEIKTCPFACLDLGKVRRAAVLLIEREGAEELGGPLQDDPEAFSYSLRSMLDYGRNASPEKVTAMADQLAHVREQMVDLFDSVDLLMTPTSPQTAFPFEGPKHVDQADLTALANICGWPAISLPYGLDADGLPLGVQLMAPNQNEAFLLNVAAVLENAWGILGLNGPA